MKKSYISYPRLPKCLLILVICCSAHAVLGQQNSVSIGTQNINEKAVLMLVSPAGNQGLIVPVVSSRSAVGATASEAGMVVFDQTDNRIYYWDGSAWIGIGGGASGGDNWGTQTAETSGVVTGTGVTGDPIKLADGSTVNQILVWDGSQWALQPLSTGGTVTSISTGTGLTGGPITNSGTISIAAGGITSNEIADNTITGADISTTSNITASSFSGDGSGLTNINASSIQGEIVSTTTPTTGQVLQYNAGQWQPVTLSAGTGDITAVNTSNGITGGVTNGDANLSLSNTGSGQILVGDGTTVNSVAVSGDATLSSSGVLTLANSGVTAGTYRKVTVDEKGRVTSGAALTLSDIPSLPMSKISDAGTLATQNTVALNQIDAGGAAGGQVLQFNSGTGFWEPATVAVSDNQTLTLNSSTNVLTISNGNTADLSEFQQNLTSTSTGTTRTINISGGTGTSIDIADGDFDATNEFQDLTLATNTLSMTNSAVNIDLSPYLDNTDTQNASQVAVSPTGNLASNNVQLALQELQGDLDGVSIDQTAQTGILTGNGTTITGLIGTTTGNVLKWSGSAWIEAPDDVNDGDFDATNEFQDLTLATNTLSMTNSAVNIDLTPYLDNTDTQNASQVAVSPTGNLASNNVQLALQELQGDLDGISIDQTAQTGILTGNGTTITGLIGTTTGNVLKWSGSAWIEAPDDVNDGDFDATNEFQDLTLATNTLSMTNSAVNIDLSPYLDNTDTQNASQVAVTPTGNLASTDVQLALAELQGDIDGISIDQTAQTGILTGNGTTITGLIGTTTGNVLKWSGSAWIEAPDDVNDGDFDATNEFQDLTLATNTLSMTNSAVNIDLSPYLDNTDTQNASQVAVTPTGNLASTDVQLALNELQGDINGLNNSSLSDLSDALITAPADGHLLLYNSGNTQFENVPLGGDAIINSAGTLNIADDAITLSKIADNGTTRAILANNATGDVVWLQPSGANQVVGTDASSNLTFKNVVLSTSGGGTGIRTAGTAVDDNLTSELAVREAINSTIGATSLANNAIPRANAGSFVASTIQDNGTNVSISGDMMIGSITPEADLHILTSSGSQLKLGHINQPTREWLFAVDAVTKLELINENLGTPATAMAVDYTGKISMGDNVVNSSALLSLNSTTGGLLIPRMTTTQRNALSAITSLMLYNTSTSQFEYHNGSGWVALGSDNLGNHTATANIQTAGNFISNDGGNEGLFIDAAGNVGIGHNLPTAHLHLKTTTPSFDLESTGSTGGFINLITPTSTWSMKNHSDEFRLMRAGSEIFVVESNGEVGVGPSNLNPSATLDVNSIGNTSTTYAMLINNSSTTSLMAVRDNGSIGIGTTTPVNQLDVEGKVAIGAGYSGLSSAPTNGLLVEGFVGVGTDDVGFPIEVHGGVGYIISVEKDDASNTAYMRFVRQGTLVGSITETGGTVSYNSFTGSHLAKLTEEVEEGYLVSIDNTYEKSNEYRLSEPIYNAHITAKPNDSKVLGAYLHRSSEEYDENVRLIMAVGNGFMWVVDNGENLNVGDYLISSDIPGHAMLDKGEYDMSNIIARVAEPVVWEDESKMINGIKHKRISVFFESFTIDNTAKKLAEEMERYKLKTKELEEKLERLMQLLELNAKQSEN